MSILTALGTWLVGVLSKDLVSFIWGLITDLFKKWQEDRSSDQAADQHAADTTKEMENTSDPAKMDQADQDILSGK